MENSTFFDHNQNFKKSMYLHKFTQFDKILAIISKIVSICLINVSFYQPVTKNQLQKNKCQQIFFVVVAHRKEKRQGCLFSFRIVTISKNVSWHLMFRIWFLVNGWRSEKKNNSNVTGFDSFLQPILILQSLIFWMGTKTGKNFTRSEHANL